MERGEILNGSVLITIQEIQFINGGNYEQALREHETVRKSLGFGSDTLMVSQYCNYFDLDEDEIFDFLNGLRFDPNENAIAKYGLCLESLIDWENEDLVNFQPEETYEEYQTTLNEKGGINGHNTNNQ
jgi:hypothetical protein